MSNENLLDAIAKAIGQYQTGDISLFDLQAAIAANVSALDSEVAYIATELRNVDAYSELVQHGLPAKEQKAAAMTRLADLRSRLPDINSGNAT